MMNPEEIKALKSENEKLKSDLSKAEEAIVELTEKLEEKESEAKGIFIVKHSQKEYQVLIPSVRLPGSKTPVKVKDATPEEIKTILSIEGQKILKELKK